MQFVWLHLENILKFHPSQLGVKSCVRDNYMWVHTNVLGPIGSDCSSRTSKLYCKQMEFTFLFLKKIKMTNYPWRCLIYRWPIKDIEQWSKKKKLHISNRRRCTSIIATTLVLSTMIDIEGQYWLHDHMSTTKSPTWWWWGKIMKVKKGVRKKM
jgi:hypothetical protein